MSILSSAILGISVFLFGFIVRMVSLAMRSQIGRTVMACSLVLSTTAYVVGVVYTGLALVGLLINI